MLVISRNTAFTYKDKPVNAKQIGRELGVRYVLEGSVQRSGKRVRVTAQLIDAETDAHLWAERFDRDTGDLFALQNDITSRLANALGVELIAADTARPTERPDALDDVGLQFLGREQASHAGNKPGQFPRELWPAGGRLGEHQQFFGDDVIECRRRPIAQPDVSGGLALLHPNLVEFAIAHVIPPGRRCRAASGREDPIARLDYHRGRRANLIFAAVFPSNSPRERTTAVMGHNGSTRRRGDSDRF